MAKKINCSVKGKVNEREIVKILNKRFEVILSNNKNWGLFSRTVGSGNRLSQTTLSDSAKQVFTSDISAPPNFKFTIESKAGYPVDLCSAFDSGHKILDSFLKQATEDGNKSGKHPLVFWKKNRQPRLAFINHSLLNNISFEYYMKYNNWIVITLDELLKLPDSFFFTQNQS